MEHQFGAMNLNGPGGPRPGGAPPTQSTWNQGRANATVLKGFTLRRAEVPKGQRQGWSLVSKVPWSIPESELQRKVEAQKRSQVSKSYEALSPNQQTQVDLMVAQEMDLDRSPTHEWRYVYIKASRKALRGATGWEIIGPSETVVIYVILRRSIRGHSHASQAGIRNRDLGQIVDLNAPKSSPGGHGGHVGALSHFTPHSHIGPGTSGSQGMHGPANPPHHATGPPPQPRPPQGYHGSHPGVTIVPNGPPRPNQGGGHAGPPQPPGYRGTTPGVTILPNGPARGGHGGPPPPPMHPGAGAGAGARPGQAGAHAGAHGPIPPPPMPPMPMGKGKGVKVKIHGGARFSDSESSQSYSDSDRETDSETAPSSFASTPSSPRSSMRHGQSYLHVKPASRKRSDSRGPSYREHHRASPEHHRRRSSRASDDFEHSMDRHDVRRSPSIHRRNSMVSERPAFFPSSSGYDVRGDHPPVSRGFPLPRVTYRPLSSADVPDLSYDAVLARQMAQEQAREEAMMHDHLRRSSVPVYNAANFIRSPALRSGPYY
ncbi:MAG: hypothetical protein M1838_001319 [Thelocarpon superellum]|nr:MAG: hypothetical protein M1838_001319 [Thelocarpon superellum]